MYVKAVFALKPRGAGSFRRSGKYDKRGHVPCQLSPLGVQLMEVTKATLRETNDISFIVDPEDHMAFVRSSEACNFLG